MIKKEKRGQVTLFIILGLLLVVSIFLVLYYSKPEFMQRTFKGANLEDCLKISLDKKIKELSLSAGLLNPKFVYPYKGENYTYLCYTEEYYKPCVNQEPFLKEAFESSLKKVIKDDFEKCYEKSINDLKKRGFDVESGEIKFNLDIEPGEVRIILEAPTTIKQGEISSTKKKYSSRYKTNLYDVLMIATSLIQFETYYGDSEQMQQMFFYPHIKILKERRDDQTKVYSVIEKNENIRFNFAVKSYPWPEGRLI